MIRTALLLSCILALAGCARQWVKPGADAADFERELYTCQRETSGQADHFVRRDMVNRCLRVKGWSTT